MAQNLDFLKMRYDIDEHLKVGFMMLKEIKSGMIFDTTIIRVEKLNNGKGFSGSQWNPKVTLIL